MDEPPSLSFLLSISSDLGLVYPVILILAVLLLSLSALASASESAFFSIPEELLKQLRKSAKARATVTLLDQHHLLFTTIRLFGTMVRIGFLTISVLILLDNSGKSHTGLVIVYMAFATALFVDVVPKIYAKRYALPLARITSLGWSILVKICEAIFGRFVELNQSDNSEFHESGIGSDTLSNVMVLGPDNIERTPREKDILMSIANFGNLTVGQVMRSRDEISSIDFSSSFSSVMSYVDKCGFSRIPVFRNTMDTIEGILYIKDLLSFLDHPEGFQWQTLIRPGFFIRENKKIESLLKDFQEKKVHIAIVVDEYGKTIGLVTLEDLIEEIIGEINDEFDDVETSSGKIENDTFVFDGKTSLQDFCVSLEIDQRMVHRVSGEAKTLSDFILSLNPGFSRAGDQIHFEHLTFVVESADKKGIKKVRVKVHEQA